MHSTSVHIQLWSFEIPILPGLHCRAKIEAALLGNATTPRLAVFLWCFMKVSWCLFVSYIDDAQADAGPSWIILAHWSNFPWTLNTCVLSLVTICKPFGLHVAKTSQAVRIWGAAKLHLNLFSAELSQKEHINMAGWTSIAAPCLYVLSL